jgi:hypothetical protein
MGGCLTCRCISGVRLGKEWDLSHKTLQFPLKIRNFRFYIFSCLHTDVPALIFTLHWCPFLESDLSDYHPPSAKADLGSHWSNLVWIPSGSTAPALSRA